MILVALCAPLFWLVTSIISLIPSDTYTVTSAPTGLISMFYTAFQFFPADVCIICLGSFVFWITVHLIYGLINFTLRLIPLLNIGQ